jgi:outer membrane protein
MWNATFVRNRPAFQGSTRRVGGAARWLFVAMVLALATLGGTARAEGKFAIVDLRRAVIQTEDGLRVQARLKQLFDNRQQELDQKQRGLQDQKATLEKDAKAGKVSKADLQKKYETLQQQAMELQGMAMEYQREMERQDKELTGPIIDRMMALIRRVASQGGFDMVLDKSAVPYFRSDLDLTDRLIQLYNAGEGESAKAPEKPAATPVPAPRPKKK